MENQKQKFLTYEEFIRECKGLAQSQGKWGRLLREVTSSEESIEYMKEVLEENKYTDMVDFIMREEY